MLTEALKIQIRSSVNKAKDNMPGFIVRHAQNKMIAEISKTLTGEYSNSNKILCVEAPTGTGKTFAYLASAIPIAKENNKKLVVSSANVALQEQLLNKDIVDIKKYSDIDFEYALVKGRSRYVCIRNLINIAEENNNTNSLFDNATLWDDPPGKYQLEQLNAMLDDYSDRRWNGEIDDLSTQPDTSIWQKICANRFTCNAKSCDLYNDCAFFKARKAINKADVIVANHDLVLADLSTGGSVLPDIDESIYIFDEAHHLNSKALSHFCISTSTEYIKTSVRQTAGISTEICKIIDQDLVDIDIKKIDSYIADLSEILKTLEYGEDVHLFNQGVIDKNIAIICKNISTLIQQIYNKFAKLKEAFENYQKIQVIDKAIVDTLNNSIGECDMHLISIVELFISLLEKDDPNNAPHSRWVEKNILASKKTNFTLSSAKIDISQNLSQIIWSKAFGVVLTSATLSSLGSFDRLNQQLGLNKKDNQYLRLPSPFNFSNVDFIIAKLKANPTQVYEHTQEIASQLIQRIDFKSGSLVLFASNKQMQMVADLVEDRIGCDLFVQGEFSKKLILEKHTKLIDQNKGSVIFGLDSFAEGVDLKGKYLTHVFIAKLRFSVPTSPIDKTLSDYLESQNRNPFMEVSLPDASLRLIQACGRLIRTETDSGKITIFDNRLISKFYGKQLLDALPGYNIVVE